jgi:prepilin peptidase CpaA
MGMIKHGLFILTALFATIAGISDWRSRRIPNWLTVPGLLLGIAANSAARGWPGAKDSLLGAGLGLLLLFPFVLLRSLGAGDWKMVGALGAFLGPQRLITVLFVAVSIAGVMALILIIWKGRVRRTLRNIAHMLAALFSFHLPGPELSLENPDALKVPFGVAVAIAVIAFTAGQVWHV